MAVSQYSSRISQSSSFPRGRRTSMQPGEVGRRGGCAVGYGSSGEETGGPGVRAEAIPAR